MDLIHTLLSFLASLVTTAVIALQVVTGGFFASDQKITILLPESHTSLATSSSIALIATSSSTTSTTTKTTKSKTTSKPAATSLSSTIPKQETPVVTPPPSPAISAEELNTATRGSLVNILCLTQGGAGVHSISGSGVFIDNRGVILTNAHIGQLFLLKDYPTPNNVDCTIRTGSPAQPHYRATLLFLPPTWVTDNASQIVAPQAKGTGENDYAFLQVTSSTGPEPLPTSFPHLSMAIAEPDINDLAFLAAYPAGFLDGSTIEKNLFPTSAYAAVTDLFTFGTGRDVDLISVGGTIVSQGGSSGGAAVRANDGKLVALIATATTGDTTAQRDLRAITLGHIDRSLIAHGQGGLAAFLSQDLTHQAALFASTTAPIEKETLVKVLEHR
jgi:hypothetical protein